MALEIFRLVGSVFVDTDQADKSLKKTDKNAEGFGTKLLGAGKAAGKFALGVVGAAGAAGAALVAVAENTREYRTEQGKLQAAFETSGFSAETARSTYEALNGVLGDSGQAVEAANHLAKLTDSEEGLAAWTDICTGVFATFGDSLPIESLTEAANETAKTGQITGALADALNWAGVSEEEFQAQLDACNSEADRAYLITEQLVDSYYDQAEAYRDINGEVISANEAQDKLNQSMAAVGGAIEPLLTWGKLLLAEVFEKLTPVLTYVSEVAIPWLMDKFSQLTGWIQGLTGKLGESGITFETVLAKAKEIFQNVMTVIKQYWEDFGRPVWNFIKEAVLTVAGYFQQKMPEIQAFVKTAFSDIKDLWNNNLRPALQAIGNFIENVLAPAFKFVFQYVIAPVIDNVFNTIKKLWTGTLKPVFQGILDFITGIFSGDFKKAFSGLVKAVGGIWEGLVTIIKHPINRVISVINAFIGGINKLKIPDWVPGVGGKGINIPLIPQLAEGGVLERGQVGFLEGNGAEAVVPLHQNKQWISAVAQDMDSALGGGGQAVALLRDILDVLEAIAGTDYGMNRDAMVRALVDTLAKPMDKKLGQLQAAKARA